MKLEITVTLPTNCAADLSSFVPVEGKWSVSEPDMFDDFIRTLVGVEASGIVNRAAGEDVSAEDFRVELFRSDGRSLDGSAGITSGNLLVTRRA
jgi:hypothetical protein